MKIIALGIVLLSLGGCNALNSNAYEMQIEANRCEGKVTLSIQKRGDEENITYTCEVSDV